MGDSQEVSLLVDGKVFRAKKELLCEYSDYFKAMFSGSYVEQNKSEIEISIVDAKSMDILLRYMEIGCIDLSEYTLSAVGDLAITANFLQITELIKQIKFCLENELTPDNWLETMIVAENSSYKDLEQLCAMFGLLSFKSAKLQCIGNIYKLFWYLAHPCLDAPNELEVFKFGFSWITCNKIGADALLIILSCLDVKRIKCVEIREIQYILKYFVNSLAAKVVDCLHDLTCNNYDLTESVITDQKSVICEKFTESVYRKVLNIVKASYRRIWNYTPVIPCRKITDGRIVSPQSLCFYNEKTGFETWLDIPDQDLWGWNVAAWSGYKLVLVCGEHGRGTGNFMKDVIVYDTFKKEWIWHGVQLPPRRHGSVAISEDLLYIVGGVGKFRVTLDTAIVYNLKERTYRLLANLPDAIQNPGICFHQNILYASGHCHIYMLQDVGERDSWVTLVSTKLTIHHMISFKGYIYLMQNFHNQLYRYLPGSEDNIKIIRVFNNPPTCVCDKGDRLLFFAKDLYRNSRDVIVEEYTGDPHDQPKVIWRDQSVEIIDVAGFCNIAMSLPPVNFDISPYHKQCLKRYAE